MIGNLSNKVRQAALGIRAWGKRDHSPGAWLAKGALSGVLSHAGFQFVDVGARGGAMRQLSILSPVSHYFACEPEPEEAQRLVSSMDQDASWRGITVFHEALSTRMGEVTLYICNQSGLSSLLQPNLKLTRKYYNDDRFEICREVSVPTITLDDAAVRYGFKDASFIKLDTQGTELDILHSGEKLLSKAVLGVYVEVEFQPFYRDQPLFADVDAYLRSLGFSLFDLQRTLIRRASHRNDLYSRRQVVWADALYLRDPAMIAESDPESVRLRLSRLLGIAIAFEHFDLALDIATVATTTAGLGNEWSDTIKKELEILAFARTKVAKRMARSRRQRPQPAKFMYTDRNRL